MVYHFGEKAGGVGAARETEHVDIVVGSVVPHHEDVAGYDVVAEGDAPHLVEKLFGAVFDCVSRFGYGAEDVGSDSSWCGRLVSIYTTHVDRMG